MMGRDNTDVTLSVQGIPRRYESGFAKLRQLEQHSLQMLSTALRDAPPTMDATDLTKILGGKVDTIPRDDLAEIAHSLLSLTSLQADFETSTASVADAIASAMERSDSEKLRLPKEDRERFKSILTDLLSSNALQIAGKARSLQFEDEHVFQDARIVTDIRPVFGDSIQESPVGAILVHKLKLTYLRNKQLEDFFIELDSRDVRILRGLLDRADAKGDRLISALGTAGVQHIRVREDS